MRHRFERQLLIAAGSILPSIAGAQIRTPIATVSAPVPGPAVTNLKAVATSPTAISLSWDAAAGVKSYLVERRPAGTTTCCTATSPMLTTAGWQDGSLTGGGQYSYAVTVLYLDGRSGTTEVTASTPFSTITLSSAAIRGSTTFACTYKKSAGPPPGAITATAASTPGGAQLTWSAANATSNNYVVERAPSGMTTWQFVGSTCGGPSPIQVGPPDAAGNSVVTIKDLSGGVQPTSGQDYVYRVTLLGSHGEWGWNTVHWVPPCSYPGALVTTPNGNSVTVQWGTVPSNCGNQFGVGSRTPDTYTLSTSWGYVKSKAAAGWNQEVIYGVPVGQHSIYLTSGWRTDTKTTPSSAVVIIAY